MSKPRILRPRRNRLTPLGTIEATRARGTVLANRGDLHGEDGTVAHLWQRRRWITCELVSPTGGRVTFDTPGHYTPLFALDEAVALAAGHRPCAECRRPAYDAFVAAWRKAHRLPADKPVRAHEIDKELHAGRIRRGQQVTYAARLGRLPDGAFVALPDEPDQPYLFWAKQLWPWSHAGYGRPQAAPLDAVVTVLTPAPAVEVLRAGYRLTVKWPEWVPNRHSVSAAPAPAPAIEASGAPPEAPQDAERVRRGRQRREAPGAAPARPSATPGQAEEAAHPPSVHGATSPAPARGEANSATPRQLNPFVPLLGDVSLRDDRRGMFIPFLSLSKRKRLLSLRWQHGREWVRVTANQEHGMATIYDWDILIWAISQLNEAVDAGRPVSPLMRCQPYNILSAIGRHTSGREYAALESALNRLAGTMVETNVRVGDNERKSTFHLIERWDHDIGPSGESKGIYLTLPRWLFDGVVKHRTEVLKIPRDYFDLTSGVARWLYRVARHKGGTQEGGWGVKMRHLFERSGSTNENEFKRLVRKVVRKQSLPEYSLSLYHDAQGDECVSMVRDLEKVAQARINEARHAAPRRRSQPVD